jgi:hypothetical protein
VAITLHLVAYTVVLLLSIYRWLERFSGEHQQREVAAVPAVDVNVVESVGAVTNHFMSGENLKWYGSIPRTVCVALPFSWDQ